MKDSTMTRRKQSKSRLRSLLGGFLFLLISVPVAYLGFHTLSNTPAMSAPKLRSEAELVDEIIVRKAERIMTLMRHGQEVSRHSIRLGFTPDGHKMQEGDGKTPEGVYRIDRRNPYSRFHLSLGINYPTPAQRKAAKQKGVSPGGDIFIHGQPNRLKGLGIALPYDWTDGCVAVSNKEIETIYTLVPIGTKVTILP